MKKTDITVVMLCPQCLPAPQREAPVSSTWTTTVKKAHWQAGLQPCLWKWGREPKGITSCFGVFVAKDMMLFTVFGNHKKRANHQNQIVSKVNGYIHMAMPAHGVNNDMTFYHWRQVGIKKTFSTFLCWLLQSSEIKILLLIETYIVRK